LIQKLSKDTGEAMNNTKNTLVKHYDEKYARDAKGDSLEFLDFTSYPVNRFEACVHYLTNYLQDGDILELASGNGIIAGSLLKNNSKIQSYTASEFSKMRLEGIKKNVADERLQLKTIDAEMVPENEFGKYDVVIMIALIEHLIDPLRAMKQIRKLLRPGGMVYIDTPNFSKYTRRLKLLMGRFPAIASVNEGLTKFDGSNVDLYDEGHLHYFTYRSLELMLKNYCGFSRIIKAPYYCGKNIFGKKLSHSLAQLWPEMFAELAVIAFV